MSKTTLITGATGMVGGFALRHLLADKRVGKVISIGRRTTGLKHEKLKEIIHSNFLDFTPIKDILVHIDVCIYCLGVYQNQVSKKQFFEITCNYQKALTDTLAETSPDLSFCLFGAQGADTTERSRVAFVRYKGMAENLLHATPFPRKYIFRPGYIHPTGHRKPSGWVYTYFAIPLGALMFRFFPKMGITDTDLAKAMVNVGLAAQSPSRVFTNEEMKAFVS